MIPKIVHYCWFGGRELPMLSLRCIDTWRKYLCDYELVRWDESNVSFDSPFLREMKEKKQWAFISDYMRMKILAEYGGIYLDTDIEVVKSFNDLLGLKCFLGCEARDRINTAVLGAEKNHQFLKECMRLIDERHRNGLPYMIAPEVATKACEITSSSADVVVLPEEAFYPYNPYDEERKCGTFMYADVTPGTYAVHHWGKSWQMPFLQRFRRAVSRFINTGS